MAIDTCMESKSFKFDGDGKEFVLISARHARDGAYIPNYYGASISLARARNLDPQLTGPGKQHACL
jgi:hypothetical protein